MANTEDKEFGLGFITGCFIATVFWLFFLGISDDLNRVGHAYVANERYGYVVRMDNTNGNTTNLTKGFGTPEEATQAADKINDAIKGHENH